MGMDLARVPCVGGEERFCPDGLLVAAWFGRARRLEQVSGGHLWSGVIARGDLHVLAPGEDRTFRKKDAGEYVCLSIATPLAEALDPTRRALRAHVVVRDAPLLHLVEALLAETGAGPTTQLFRDAAAQAVVARLAALEETQETARRPALSGAVLARVVDLLRARLADDVSVAELAELAGMSACYFATLFRNATGEPPHRYQLRLRVERARCLIEGGLGPTEAALAVGFCDQSHLTRHMRRLLGVTPGALARSRPRRAQALG